jgi:hypothetical protein
MPADHELLIFIRCILRIGGPSSERVSALTPWKLPVADVSGGLHLEALQRSKRRAFSSKIEHDSCSSAERLEHQGRTVSALLVFTSNPQLALITGVLTSISVVPVYIISYVVTSCWANRCRQYLLYSCQNNIVSNT